MRGLGPAKLWPAAACEPSCRAAAAARELVGVVGDAPGPGRDPEGAVRRPRGHGGRDQPARPRHPPGPGRGPRRRRRRRRARRRRHAQRGGQRPGRHRHRARRAARRVDQRLRPHHRPAQRPDRGHRRRCSTASLPSSIEEVGLGSVNGRYFLFHVGIGFDAAVVEQVERRAAAQAVGRPSAVLCARRSTTWFRHYDQSRPRFSVCIDDESAIVDGVLLDVLNTNPYTFLGNRPFDLAPRPPSTAASAWSRSGRWGWRTLAGAGLAALTGAL